MQLVTNSLQQAIIVAEMARLLRFKNAWDAYAGNVPDTLKVKEGQPNDNVKPNFAEVIVDKGVDFLFGSDLSFEVEGDQPEAEGAATEATDQTVDKAATQWLKAAWEENQGMLTLAKMATNGGVTGHVFVKIVPGGTESGFPRIVVLDPATVYPEWMPNDIDDVYRYRIQYTATRPGDGKPTTYREIYTRLEGGKWEIEESHSDPDSTSWTVDRLETWPLPWPPIAHCQNLPAPNEFWGTPDLTQHIIDLIRAIDFVLSNILRIIRFHAHPKTWAKGVDASQIKINVDGIIGMPHKDAELKNLEMINDLAGSINFYVKLKEALHEVSRIPEIATGKVENLGQLSGFALTVLYGPLADKTKTKRLTYGYLIKTINRRMLELGGKGKARISSVKWPELVPQNPADEASLYTVLKALGVSERTILQKLGYNPETEQTQSNAEKQNAFKIAQATGANLLDQINKGNVPGGNDE